jgi:hypothetical protein
MTPESTAKIKIKVEAEAERRNDFGYSPAAHDRRPAATRVPGDSFRALAGFSFL